MSANSDPAWTDEELLGYVELHSKTERALFHVSHINRLLELSGHPKVSWVGFASMYYPEARPLIEEARRRLAERAKQREVPVVSDQKHEFQPGGRWIDEIEEDDCCFYCGQSALHENHCDPEGDRYVDTDTVFDRMRADGSVAPRMPERDGKTS